MELVDMNYLVTINKNKWNNGVETVGKYGISLDQ